MRITDTDGHEHDLAGEYVPAAVRRLRSAGRGNRTIDFGGDGPVTHVTVSDEEAARIITEYAARLAPAAPALDTSSIDFQEGVYRQLRSHELKIDLEGMTLVGKCACFGQSSEGPVILWQRVVRLTKHHPIDALAIIEREHAHHLSSYLR